jgi:hypothetical protein
LEDKGHKKHMLRVPGLNDWHRHLKDAGVAEQLEAGSAGAPGKQRQEGRLEDEDIDGEGSSMMTAVGKRVNKHVTFNLPATVAVGSPLPVGAALTACDDHNRSSSLVTSRAGEHGLMKTKSHVLWLVNNQCLIICFVPPLYDPSKDAFQALSAAE